MRSERSLPVHTGVLKWRAAAYRRAVTVVVRVARVLLILVLALLAVSFLIGVGTAGTGPLEKVVLLALAGLCVYAAAKVSAVAEWLVDRLTRV